MISLILRVTAFLCFVILVLGHTLGTLRLFPLAFALWVLADLLGGVGPVVSFQRKPTPPAA